MKAVTNWDYQEFVKLFRTGEDSSNIAFKNAIAHCLRELYKGNMKFRDVIVDGFMHSRDYVFLIDISMEEYDDFEKLKKKIEEFSTILGFSLE